MKVAKKGIFPVLYCFLCVVLILWLKGCANERVPNSAGAALNADLGARALNSSLKAAEAGTGLSKMLSPLGKGVAKQVFGLDPAFVPTFSGSPAEVNCTDGGTMLLTGFDTAQTDFNFQIDFSNCRENGIQIDGVALAQGSSNLSVSASGRLEMTLTLGDAKNNLLIQNFQTVNSKRYGHLKSLLSTKLTLRYQVSADRINAFKMTLNGSASYDDFFEKTGITFLDFSTDGILETQTLSFGDIETASTFVMNGDISESQSKNDGTHLTFLTYKNLLSQNIVTESTSGQTKDLSFSGDVTVLFSSNRDCGFQGAFSIETLTPLHYLEGETCPVSGALRLSSVSGIANHKVNADQSMEIDVNGEVRSFSDCSGLFGLCAFENFQTGFLSKEGLPGTQASGDRQFITLVWRDSPSFLQVSDMDLHVGYYNNPRPATGPANALVSWHSGGGDDCGDTRFPSLFSGVPAILDIDDCSGFGPEHVSISGLPAGYYVIAVNSFDMKGVGSTSVTVTVEIGKEVFTFPDKTFLVDDLDKTEPNAWYRVTDLQCLSPGVCTLLAPNPALQVHDDPTLF